MILKLVYFARLRESFGLAEESADLDCTDVAGLLALLRARGGAWASELAEGRVFRVAVNQELVSPAQTLKAGDEVAVFPPVTGG